MKKQFFIISTIICLIMAEVSFAAKNGSKPQVGRGKAVTSGNQVPVKQLNSNNAGQVQRALDFAKSGQTQNAINQLFSLSRRSEFENERPMIKYNLGLLLMDLKLYQVAAFQFVDVIRSNSPKYLKASIEKLSIVADSLGDDTLLNYAIARVDIKDIPNSQKDMVYFRMGEVKQKSREFGKAVELYSKVQPSSTYFYQAQFNKGLSELEGNQFDFAIHTFFEMLRMRTKSGVTDTNRVAAQLALARAYYQKQDWDSAIDSYSRIPRDHFMWHEALFEQSWAMLRSARFRSALSNFQTLHSAYYEDFYMPEPMLLRAIVYLFICKYDEMEKVLSLFESTYGPVRTRVSDFLKSTNDAGVFYQEIEKANQLKRKGETASRSSLRLPYIVSKNILDEGNVKRAMNYLRKNSEERERIETNAAMKTSPLGQYALKILSNRSKNTKLAIGDMVKAHLLNIRLELRDLYEQAGFIRYEMINGKKETFKKKIAGTDIDRDQIDDKLDREFYVQNGFEYYPFHGEYWLDEIGNYHYLGKQSCE